MATATSTVNNLNAAPGLYRNECRRHAWPSGSPAVRIPRVSGPKSACRSARPDGKLFVQWQEVIAGGRYLSGDGLRTFAAAPAGRNAGPLEIELAWCSGRVSRIPNAKAGSLYEIQEPSADASPPATAFPSPPTSPPRPMFEDYSNRLAHSHDEEEDYNDFERQLLLPNWLSRLGPGVCCGPLQWGWLGRPGHRDRRGGRIAL